MASRFYGVRLGDAIKFAWMDATFEVERRIDKLNRKRVHRAAGEENATEEAVNASVNNNAAETTATDKTQEAQATTEAAKKKKISIFGGKKDKKSKKNAKGVEKEQTTTETEEAIAASKEAPVEEPGSEKMDDPIVGDIESAAQHNTQQPVTGFDIGGAKFDFNMGPVERVEPTILQNSAGNSQANIFQQAQQSPVMQNPAFVQPNQMMGQQPFMGQQPIVDPTQMNAPTMVGIPNMMPQQPPLHRVDAPPKVIQSKPPRAEADNVEVSNTNVAQAFVDPNKRNKVIRDQHPDLIQKDVPHIADTPSEQLYDNRELIAAYPYLGDIQNIALKNHIQLKMQHLGFNANPMLQTGMILCYAFNDGSNTFNEYKSFTIDTGEIIDRRPKLFKGIVASGFEDMQAYSIQLNDKSNKNQSTFNTELFEKIFVGGTAMLDDKGMYSPQYRALNKYVDLISMPTKLMNGERRKAVQDRLMKAMNAGVFDKAMQMAPGSRFEFKENSYNKDRGTFVLTNLNVPIAFNAPVTISTPIEITFGSKVFIHSPNDPPVENEASAAMKESTNQKADVRQDKKQKGNNKKSVKKQEEPSVAETEPSAKESEIILNAATETSEK